MNHGSLSYRRDHRDEQTFQADIARGTKNEETIMRTYHDQEFRNGNDFSYSDSGVDNNGKLIRGERKNMWKPDYLINGTMYVDVKTNHLWESKRSAHIKSGQMKAYARDDAAILMASSTGYLWFSPELIKVILKEEKELASTPLGGKPGYRYTPDKVKRWTERGLMTSVDWDKESLKKLKGVTWGRVSKR